MSDKKLVSFCDRISFPEDFRKEVFPVIEKIKKHFPGEYEAINGNRLDEAGYIDLTHKLGMSPELVTLSLCIMMGMDSRERYSAAGADDEIYYASQKEITIWAKKNYAEHGTVGTIRYEWLNNFIDPHVFRLGRLDFERYGFWNGADCTVHGVHLHGGDACINVHIPEDGKLGHEEVLESYRKAYRFFGLEGDYPFICHSWLLYPGNRDFLPAGSNIVAFLGDYDIVNTDEFTESPDLWRIYGTRDSYVPSELPRDTGLRSALADYLISHGNVYGRGYGVFIHNGDSIIK